MRNFLSTADWTRSELQALLDRASAFKSGAVSRALEGKTIALVFFNPSLRTRSSFDIGAHQLGGHAIVLDAKGATWPMEFAPGAVMDGDEEEHVKEAARVLSSYVDLIAIRCFPAFKNWQTEREDPMITAFSLPMCASFRRSGRCIRPLHAIPFRTRRPPPPVRAGRANPTG